VRQSPKKARLTGTKRARVRIPRQRSELTLSQTFSVPWPPFASEGTHPNSARERACRSCLHVCVVAQALVRRPPRFCRRAVRSLLLEGHEWSNPLLVRLAGIIKNEIVRDLILSGDLIAWSCVRLSIMRQPTCTSTIHSRSSNKATAPRTRSRRNSAHAGASIPVQSGICAQPSLVRGLESC